MSRFILNFLFALIAIQGWGQEGLTLQSPLPKGDVKMKDVSGVLVSLNETKTANGLLIMFSSNTCPYVKRNEGRTAEILRYAEEKNIGVIILNSNEGSRNAGDSYADMQAYAKQQNYHWRYALDSHNEVADAFGANRTPECFLFDSGAKLVYHGAIDNSPADSKNVTRSHLKEAINEMLSGKDVSVKETRSVGCTIQRQ